MSLFFRPRTCFVDPDDQQWSERYPPQSNNLTENWKGQLEHWLSNTRGDAGMKCWLPCLCACVLTLNIRAAKAASPPYRFLCFSGRFGNRRGGGGCWYNCTVLSMGKDGDAITFPPPCDLNFLFLPDEEVPGTGLPL
ncbi:hypothetical protein HJG60_007855 [Phyllostomus discolor]|uniref:Uncharacterized protein n=1 Tax=Phyllostomus discolor TaxID=89673 RepID=A0A834BKQ2_9CHIR|nr:hypothetical protein HJG60_007855 [Phyllostomus discolor]